MRSLWFKLAVFLVPAIAGLFFLVSWLNPEKKIIRRADAILATAQRSGLSLTTTDEKILRFSELTEPTFEIAGPKPLPTGTITRAEAAGLLVEFHESILSCEVSRGEPAVAFPSKRVARFKCEADVKVNAGRGGRGARRYSCLMEFRRSGREWLLARLVLNPI